MALLAALFLSACSDSGDKGTTATACAVSSEAKAALDASAIGDVAAFQTRTEPTPIGDLTFNDGEGRPASIGDHAGRTVLLNLWATWCVPCREEMPALDALQKAMGGETFAVVPVSVDLGEDTKPKAFYAETGLEALPFYHDGKMGVFNALKKRSLAIGLPVSMLIDSQGCVLGILNGPADWSGGDAERLITTAIGTGGRS